MPLPVNGFPYPTRKTPGEDKATHEILYREDVEVMVGSTLQQLAEDVFGEGVYMRCLQAARHTHKLRRGQHSANHFTSR